MTNIPVLISGDIYVNFTVSGLIEFPAYTLCIILLFFVGRRIPLSFMLYLSATSLLLNLALPDQPLWILITATLGKFGIVSAYAIIYVQATEVFPTVIRNTGIGSASSIAQLGSILAPIIGRELGKRNRSLVMIIFSLVGFLAGTGTLFLPETRGKSIPDTLEDGEKNDSPDVVCFQCFVNKDEDSDKENREPNPQE